MVSAISKLSFLSGVLILCLLTWLPVGAEDPREPGHALSKKESEERFNHAEQFLKEARLSWDRDDVSGMERALESYIHNMNQLERAIDRGQVPPRELREVAEVVSRATSRHADVLLELGNKGEGQTGINWALEAAIMQLVFCKLAWQKGSPSAPIGRGRDAGGESRHSPRTLK